VGGAGGIQRVLWINGRSKTKEERGKSRLKMLLLSHVWAGSELSQIGCAASLDRSNRYNKDTGDFPEGNASMHSMGSPFFKWKYDADYISLLSHFGWSAKDSSIFLEVPT